MTESNVPPPPPDPSAARPASPPRRPPARPRRRLRRPGMRGYPGPYVGPPPDQNGKTMGMLCHLLAVFTGFGTRAAHHLADEEGASPFIDDQGKESVNFQILC